MKCGTRIKGKTDTVEYSYHFSPEDLEKALRKYCDADREAKVQFFLQDGKINATVKFERPRTDPHNTVDTITTNS